MRVKTSILIAVLIGALFVTGSGTQPQASLSRPDLSGHFQNHVIFAGQKMQQTRSEKTTAKKPSTIAEKAAADKILQKQREQTNNQSAAAFTIETKNEVQLGEPVTLTLAPQNRLVDSRYRFIFRFEDGSSATIDRVNQIATHTFLTEGQQTVTAGIDPSMSPNDRPQFLISAQIIVKRISLTPDPESVEIGIPLTLTATTVSANPNLRYHFQCDNSEPDTTKNWQPSNQFKCTYGDVRTYTPTVSLGLADKGGTIEIDKGSATPINVTASTDQPSLDIDPKPARVGEVSFTVTFPAKNRHIQYQFLFDDGPLTNWQDSNLIKNTYSIAGEHNVSVTAGVLIDKNVASIATTSRSFTVTAAEQESTSPRQPTPRKLPMQSPKRPPIKFDRMVYAALAIFLANLIGSIGVLAPFATYKTYKFLFPPEPTLVPFPGATSGLIDRDRNSDFINFHLVLNPNLDQADIELTTNESSFIASERPLNG